MMADRDLAKTLSARYYQPARSSLSTGRREASQRTSDDQSGLIENVVGPNESIPEGSARPSPLKRRGRPKMHPDTSAQDRRTQIRRAQRTYRLKKENALREMTTRVTELEETIDRISASFTSLVETAVQSELAATHPDLFSQMQQMIDQLRADHDNRLDRQNLSSLITTTRVLPVLNHSAPLWDGHIDESPFGLLLSAGRLLDDDENPSIMAVETPDQPPPCILPALVERPLSGTSILTNSFSETDISRKLHRYCLEHMYRVLTDPRCDPQVFYRLFRLVPCVRYKDRLIPYMKCLVRSGPNEELELPAVPFYCIGGAGTHYPRTDETGQPIYPQNMRLPRKILGTVSTDADGRESADRETLLKLNGLDGVWFDCRDIQGYLEEKGLVPDSASRVYAHGILSRDPRSHQHMHGTRAAKSVLRHAAMVDLQENPQDKQQDGPRGMTWILNIESFFQLLLQKMVVLGRAPGFRLQDVDTAFKSCVRIELDG